MANKIKAGKTLPPDEFPNKINLDWLKQKLTFEEIEALREKRASDSRLLKRNEWMEAEWIKFTEQIQAGGEVWEYSTPRRYWNVGFGHAGYVVLQQGKAVAWMKTKMN